MTPSWRVQAYEQMQPGNECQVAIDVPNICLYWDISSGVAYARNVHNAVCKRNPLQEGMADCRPV